MAKKNAIESVPIKSVKSGRKAEPKAESVDAAPEDFFADEKRSKCLDMVLSGVPKAQIARQLEVHRNTINNWCSDPRFIAAANQKFSEYKASKRMRRMMATGAITDKIEKLTMQSIDKLVEKAGTDGKGKLPGTLIRNMREIAFELRAFREEERKDFGDDVKRIAMQSNHTLTGDVQVTHSINNVPFGDFVKSAIENNVIDVEAIDEKTDGKLLLQATERILQEGDILDIIDEEDRQTEYALQQQE